MDKKPNILFLMSDQLRYDVLGYNGNSIVRTPTIDHLAEKGVVFTNAYTPSPICVPARQCMMAGQWPKTCKCQAWGDDLEPFYMTFARRFSQYAYSTIACGKLHHIGPDQMQGWNLRVGQDNAIWAKYISGKKEEEFKKYDNPGQWWPWAKEVKRAGVGRDPHIIIDEYNIQGAINIIDEYFNSPYYDKEQIQRPLLLKVGLRAPHYPYMTTEDKLGYYLNRVKPFYNQQVFPHPFLSQNEVKEGVDVSEREIRRATAAYYGRVETIDEFFKKVLDRLEYVGENLDNWIIIFTNDHGDMLGEHGNWMKCQYFEGSVKVPLIIRWPKEFPESQKIDKNVNPIDLFATLCELAHIPVPSGLDSRSLVPLMKGEDSNWDNETISAVEETLMIKREHLKYQYYGEDAPEVLFDLKKNPEETINYIDEPGYSEQIQLFRKRRKELGYGPQASSK